MLKYQVELFNQVADVMSLVDLPRTFWDKTRVKMAKELENRVASLEQRLENVELDK